MRKMILIASFLISIVLPAAVRGQWSILSPARFPDFYVGVQGGVGLTFHRGTYSAYENSTECGTFTNGNGFAALAGLYVEFPLSDRLSIVGSFLYDDRSGAFTKTNQGYPILGPNNTLQEIALEQSLDVTARYLAIAPLLKIRVLDFGLGVVIGPSFGFLTSNSFVEKETILSPISATYLDNTQSRTVVTGEIKSVNRLLVDAKGGFLLEIQMGRKLTLIPEILGSYSIAKVTGGTDWRSLRAEGVIVLRFGL